MITLTLEQSLEIHAMVVETTGGSTGLRDFGRLEAAIATQTQNVFGKELYVEVVDKAAAVIRGIITDHAFVDGNKRTALLAGLTLLEINSIEFIARAGEIEDFAVSIPTDHPDIPEISTWLRKHIK
jgi:death-on-curing protein